jgi:hypothetical protein
MAPVFHTAATGEDRQRTLKMIVHLRPDIKPPICVAGDPPPGGPITGIVGDGFSLLYSAVIQS